MTRVSSALCLLLFAATTTFAQSSAPASAAKKPASAAKATAATSDFVSFEMMTQREVYQAIHDQGKTIALIYNGSTEQRGPVNVNGGHTFMARETVKAIARKLGNAIPAPVLPFAPGEADPNLPGSIGITPATFAAVNEEITEQLIKDGFKTVVLMGDHGGGQKELKQVAERLEPKYAPQGIHVYYAGETYAKAQPDFLQWLKDHKYPESLHAGIMDTSEMLYLGGDKGWTRKELLATAVGDPLPKPGEKPVKKTNNGIQGDARPSTPALGKRIFDMKVDYAVAEIKRLMANTKTSSQ